MQLPIKMIRSLVLSGWIILSITLLFLLVLELSLQLYYREVDSRDYKTSLDYQRFKADTYQGQQWPEKYYEEHREAFISRWEPYVQWRREPYQGEYININKNGIRKTWQAQDMDLTGIQPLEIYMFGGSTMWGTGARDNFTIPSHMAKLLAEKGVQANISNFGESSFTSTQGVLTLMLLLRQNKHPDIVIFYDGFNDATSALVQNTAGIPFNEDHRKHEYNLHKKGISELLCEHLWPRLGLNRLSTSLATTLGLKSESVYPVTNREKLAENVVEAYSFNLKLLQMLAEKYQFKLLSYWQPNIFDKPKLTVYEEKQTHSYPSMNLKEFYYQVNHQLEIDQLTSVHKGYFSDISTIFNNTQVPVFVDLVHLGETGNKIIATRMFEDVLDTDLTQFTFQNRKVDSVHMQPGE